MESFQVGLSLGIKNGRTIEWKNTIPVLPQSVATIRLAGPPELSITQKAINAAPSLDVYRFDPLPLVRAVNHLHSLGKKQAIAELKKFMKTAPEFNSNGPRDPANIDTADRECVPLIVSLLFDPIDAAHPRRPIWWIVPANEKGEELDGSRWPHYPLVIEQGLPFLVTQFHGNFGGAAPNPFEHVVWAQKHGKLRAAPVMPGSEPFSAASTLIMNLEAQEVSFDKDQVLEQAWRLLVDVIAEAPASKKPKLPQVGSESGPAWITRKAFAASVKLQWNAQRETYDLK